MIIATSANVATINVFAISKPKAPFILLFVTLARQKGVEPSVRLLISPLWSNRHLCSDCRNTTNHSRPTILLLTNHRSPNDYSPTIGVLLICQSLVRWSLLLHFQHKLPIYPQCHSYQHIEYCKAAYPRKPLDNIGDRFLYYHWLLFLLRPHT